MKPPAPFCLQTSTIRRHTRTFFFLGDRFLAAGLASSTVSSALAPSGASASTFSSAFRPLFGAMIVSSRAQNGLLSWNHINNVTNSPSQPRMSQVQGRVQDGICLELIFVCSTT